ncbi:SAM-dependent methyltransferase [Leeia oryzae]|uniref:SAM-dependent methyltransferase n=1 Tax=Leeia oryzae TaxID=356662 RepID=UPI00037D004B|nr:SAM-dependent methyltransferase [Leeia oryzae]
MAGILYLIPAPLDENLAQIEHIPEATLQIARTLTHFVVEHAKTARAYLKKVETALPLQQLSLQTLNKHTQDNELAALLQPLLDGTNVGLLSEAGCPAVADPGAQLVALAHRHNIKVVPLVGPSSILLAVMGSGLNGQRFSFQGYLPANNDDRTKTLKQLEIYSRQNKETILFIETPYRNQAMLDSLLSSLNPATRLCIAVDLTCPEEQIRTLTVGEWKKQSAPAFHKRPALFLFLAN